MTFSVLNRHDKTENPFLIPDFRENTSRVPRFTMTLSTGLGNLVPSYGSIYLSVPNLLRILL